MKRYNLVNNLLGWLCFAIAAVTYLLTIEPTASFWDCPEFILQGFKLEVGHPPGNPIFMLAARTFINFVGGDVTKVAMAVNTMSALLSAGTILLLFWTITHLAKRLLVKDDATEISLQRMIAIFGSGICGALAYTWSDTFWFSAVEGEVYAFSSFCTALVFWLILKWESRADDPHSDKYLVLIAYVIGISIAVHLLNLLCIPAIVLVVYFRKWKNTTGKGSLIALLVSFVIVGLILYGLVPGFIEMAQYFELFCVNTLGMSYNMGTLVYAIILTGSFIWCVSEFYRQRNARMMKISFAVMIGLSGILLIGSGIWLGILLFAALIAYLWMVKKLPVRILTLTALSIMVIFFGYSSYALLLIRSSAATPMNQNSPDNVFALSSYLNREQYGDRPLIYGQTINSRPLYLLEGGSTVPLVDEGPAQYAKAVKENESEKDHYVMTGHKKDYKMTPELNMLFPRIYSSAEEHRTAYHDWADFNGTPVEATVVVDEDGNKLQTQLMSKPTFAENLNFFLRYQLNHMYWRYFMWNFAGRQNDIQGQGEINHGNWISGIPFIDTPRLGDQSLLPYDEGAGNAGHNVFYMLPLLLGILGLSWQAFTSKRGIEQFWVVFFLFFMTGIAIVIYLNQTPAQVRERDYAFAGSFYAYSIWVGLGIAALWRVLLKVMPKDKEKTVKPVGRLCAAVIAACVGLAVPLQMVSQTWDDHDRSNRYTTRDFGFNYLNSLDENAIIFTNGDNDTFPLWYAQEVEGMRTDVKVVNLSYLTTDWYVNQIIRPSYEAPGIALQAQPKDYAYDKMQYSYFLNPDTTKYVNALSSLGNLYSDAAHNYVYDVTEMKYPAVYIPVDTAALIAKGRITKEEAEAAEDVLTTNLARGASGATLSQVISLDMLATSAANGWNRPVYFATTVPDRYYLGLDPYLRSTGLAYEVTPFMNRQPGTWTDTDKMYKNVTERFVWGGLDKVTEPGQIYLDETVRRMVTTHRSAMLELAQALYNEGIQIAKNEGVSDTASVVTSPAAMEKFNKAVTILDMIQEKLPAAAQPYGWSIGESLGDLYGHLGEVTGNRKLTEEARKIYSNEIDQYATNILYYQSLNPYQYNLLTRVDHYIDRYFFLDLLQGYMYYGGDIDEIEKRLEAKGVNLARLAAIQAQQKK